jgi:hypothetical protein
MRYNMRLNESEVSDTTKSKMGYGGQDNRLVITNLRCQIVPNIALTKGIRHLRKKRQP